jgi:hypothetical protein
MHGRKMLIVLFTVIISLLFYFLYSKSVMVFDLAVAFSILSWLMPMIK